MIYLNISIYLMRRDMEDSYTKNIYKYIAVYF